MSRIEILNPSVYDEVNIYVDGKEYRENEDIETGHRELLIESKNKTYNGQPLSVFEAMFKIFNNKADWFSPCSLRYSCKINIKNTNQIRIKTDRKNAAVLFDKSDNIEISDSTTSEYVSKEDFYSYKNVLLADIIWLLLLSAAVCTVFAVFGGFITVLIPLAVIIPLYIIVFIFIKRNYDKVKRIAGEIK